MRTLAASMQKAATITARLVTTIAIAAWLHPNLARAVNRKGSLTTLRAAHFGTARKHELPVPHPSIVVNPATARTLIGTMTA